MCLDEVCSDEVCFDEVCLIEVCLVSFMLEYRSVNHPMVRLHRCVESHKLYFLICAASAHTPFELYLKFPSA